MSDKRKYKQPFKFNYDYDSGNFLDRVEERLTRLSDKLKEKGKRRQSRTLDTLVDNVRPKNKKNK